MYRWMWTFGLTALVACGGTSDEEDDGPRYGDVVSLQAVAVKPPVEDATPAGLKNASRAVADDLGAVRDRFYIGEGPTNILNRLDDLDGRIEGAVLRSQEVQRKCLLEDLQDFSPQGLPESFDMKLQCHDPIDEGFDIYMGVTDDEFHLVKIQAYSTETTQEGIFAKAALDGSWAEVWIARYEVYTLDELPGEEEEDVYALHIVADSSSSDLQFSLGGHTAITSVGCGVALRSKGGLIYGSGIFEDAYHLGDSEYSCSDFTPTTFCADDETLGEAGAGQCTDVGADTFTLTPLSETSVSVTEIKALTETVLTNLTDFNEESAPPLLDTGSVDEDTGGSR